MERFDSVFCIVTFLAHELVVLEYCFVAYSKFRVLLAKNKVLSVWVNIMLYMSYTLIQARLIISFDF